MIDNTEAPPRMNDKQREHEEFRSYVAGAGLGLTLTLLPFALLQWSGMSRMSLLLTIGVCALAQIIVHFRFFLHIGWKHGRDDLQLILFSVLLMAIMLAGTLWIMASLTLRMQ